MKSHDQLFEKILANKTLAAAGLVGFSVLAFYATRSSFFAVLGFFAILLLVFSDLFSSPAGAKTDWKKTALELGQALLLALVVWAGLQFALQTSAPIDVVTSCSMLPNLERGDLIFVRKSEVQAPRIRFEGGLESLRGTLGVQRTPCSVVVAGRPLQALCASAIVFGGKTYPLGTGNDVVVFEPQPRDYGLIVHRAAAVFYNGTHEFLFTKGDNNLALDQEGGFAPVPAQDVRGVVGLRLPLLGFLKLFLFMQFEEPPGCKQLLQAGV